MALLYIKFGKPSNFDSSEVFKKWERDLNNSLTKEKCFDAMTGESTEGSGALNQSNQLFGKLSQFDGTVRRLESSVHNMKTDGWEDQFLKYNAESFKLCDQLDKLDDLKDINTEAYIKKKEFVRRVTKNLEHLKKKSIENLNSLLEIVQNKNPNPGLKLYDV